MKDVAASPRKTLRIRHRRRLDRSLRREYSALRARVTFGRSGPTTFFSMPPAAIFLSTAKEIWKRTPPKTDGFWISLSSNCNCGAKRFRTESPALLSPLPLLRTARKLSSLARYRGSALHPTYFYILRPEGPHLHLPQKAASARFDNRPKR